MEFNINSPKNSLIKLLAIINLFSILCFLFIISEIGVANQFEISLYDVYPFYSWILVLIPFITTFIAILIDNKTCRYDNDIYLVFCSLMINMFILFSLPLFRGYLFYGQGDIYAHLGIINNILLTSQIDYSSPYPIIHLFISSLSLILNLSPEKISLYMPQIFVILYSVSLVLFAKVLKCNKQELLLILLFSLIPVMGSFITINYIMPSNDAFLMLPFLLLVLFKSRDFKNGLEFSILLVILLFLYSFFHPETVLFIVMSLIILLLLFKYENKLKIKQSLDDIGFKRREIFTVILILIIATLMWFMSTSSFYTSTKTFFNMIVLHLQPISPPTVKLTQGFKMNTINAIEVIVRTYGPSLFYIIIGGIFSAITIINYLKKKTVEIRDLVLAVLFVGFSFLNLFFLTVGTSIGFEIIRQLKYSIMISTIILGIVFYKIFLKHKSFFSVPKNRFFEKIKIKKLGIVIMLSLIVFISTFSVLGTFASPETFSVNYQFTETNDYMWEFIILDGNPNEKIMKENPAPFFSRHYQYAGIFDNKLLKSRIEVQAPPHFNYNNNQNFGNYSRNTYLVLYPPINYYSVIYPKDQELWYFTNSDFELLNQDPTVNLIYNSGNDSYIYNF